MTALEAEPPSTSVIARWLKSHASYGGVVATGLLAAGGLFSDIMGIPGKVALVIVGLGLAGVGAWGVRHKSKAEASTKEREAALLGEVDFLRRQKHATAPETVLESLGSVSFVSPGAWRLTLYVIDRQTFGPWILHPLMVRASSEVLEAVAPRDISLEKSRLREILDVDTSDPAQPFSNESSNLPDREVEFEEWKRLRSQLLPHSDDTGMHTRKFGWTAVREPNSRRTLVLLSESTLPDGIRFDVVRSQLLAPTVSLVARMLGVSPAKQSQDGAAS